MFDEMTKWNASKFVIFCHILGIRKYMRVLRFFLIHLFIHVQFLGENKVEHNERNSIKVLMKRFARCHLIKHKPLISEDCRHICSCRYWLLNLPRNYWFMIIILSGEKLVCNSFFIHNFEYEFCIWSYLQISYLFINEKIAFCNPNMTSN